MTPKIIAAVIGLSAAFGSGWKVATWKLESEYLDQENARITAIQMQLDAKIAEVNGINARTVQRESELLAAIDAEREVAEGLRDEIETRPVITETIRVPIEVGGEFTCPAVPTVDWRVFADAYNRAATGSAGPGTANLGDGAVRDIAVAPE